MAFKLISFLVFTTLLVNTNDHPIHISRTEINVSTTDKEIQVSARIYIDDLELALKTANKKPTRIFVPNEAKDVDQIIEAYINSRLNIQIDGKPLNFELIGREQSEDFLAVWCYLQVAYQKPPISMKVDNHILHEIYDDQRNMVEITINGKRKNSFIVEANDASTLTQL
jgi:hypothetical protein